MANGRPSRPTSGQSTENSTTPGGSTPESEAETSSQGVGSTK